MKIVSVDEVLKGQVNVGDRVQVRGWVRTRRDSKAGFSFIAVYDGSCFNSLQVVAGKELPNYADGVMKLTTGSSVIAEGVIAESQGKGQQYEMQAESVSVCGLVEDPDTYPMSAKRHTPEYLREYAHLRARTNIMGAVLRVRNCLAQAIHRFFNENGFIWISTPLITTSDCEGAGEMFRVTALDSANPPKTQDGKVDFSKDFFGKEAFLTVSGQLNAETIASAMSKVYTFGPTFRAENSTPPDIWLNSGWWSRRWPSTI